MTESLKVKKQLWWERQKGGCGGQSSYRSTCPEVEQLWATPGSAKLRMEVGGLSKWKKGRLSSSWSTQTTLFPRIAHQNALLARNSKAIHCTCEIPPTVLVSQKAVGWVAKGRGRLQREIKYTLRNISWYRIVIIIADIYTLNLNIVWTGWCMVPHSN